MNGLAGCSVSTIGKPHEYFDLTRTPTRRAVAEFIYHHHGELNHQGLGNAFVFLDRSASSEGWHVQWERVPPG